MQREFKKPGDEHDQQLNMCTFQMNPSNQRDLMPLGQMQQDGTVALHDKTKLPPPPPTSFPINDFMQHQGNQLSSQLHLLQ